MYYDEIEEELIDIECRCDDIDDVKYQTDKFLGRLENYYLDED